MRPLAEAVPFAEMVKDVHQRPVFDAWDYAIRTGAVRLYGRAGPEADLVHIRSTGESDLIIEYSTQRGLTCVSNVAKIAEWLDLHVEDTVRVKAAPPHHDPPFHGLDGWLIVTNGAWLQAQNEPLNEVVASFQLPSHVGAEIDDIWDRLADEFPDDHPDLNTGMLANRLISQKDAKKQLQTIEDTALSLLNALRSAHPLVVEAIEFVRSQSRAESIVPDFATMAGFAGALEHVARSAQYAELMESLPPKLSPGRRADRLADALITELAALWFSYTGTEPGSREVPGQGDEPNEGGKFIIAVGEVLLGPNRIRPRRLREISLSSKK